MKTLPFALTLMLALAAQAAGQSVVINGVTYTEITDLGKPRATAVQPPPVTTALLPTIPTTVHRTTVALPADQRPVLASGGLSPSATVVPAGYSQPYVYGYGFTSNGCQAIQPIGYSNTVPLQQAVTVQPLSPPAAYNPYVPAAGVPWKPIVPIRNLPDNVVVGQGIIGQPKAYVPNQPVRNFIRYITP